MNKHYFQLFIKKQLESNINLIQPIEIIAEINTNATIKLNIIDWFSLVPISLFQQAERKTVNGVSTISISEDFNENIYTLILEKIGKNDELIIN